MIEGAKIVARTVPAAAVALLAAILLVGAAQAADVGAASRDATFAALSPGNQIIARALYDAQRPGPGRTGATALWSLDRIAAAEGDGWGAVFRRMKAAGLISSRSLGQVVNAYQATRPMAPFAPSHDSLFVITSGSNQSSVITRPARVDDRADRAVVATASGRSGDASGGSANENSGTSNDNGAADSSFVGDAAVATGAPSAGQGGGIGSGHGHGRSR